MRPVQSADVGGSQTSNLISESLLGRAVPCTRQNGTVTAAPPMVAGAVTESAAVIVEESEVTPSSALQSTAAWATPQVPRAPPIHTAPVRKAVRAARFNLIAMDVS